MGISPFEETVNDCPTCGASLQVIEGDRPNAVDLWCPRCEQVFYKSGRPVEKVGEFCGIPVFDYDEE